MKVTKFVAALVAVSMIFGCATGPKYQVLDKNGVPKEAKVGVLTQTKCAQSCTDVDLNPKLYTEALRSRLEAKLGKPVTLVPVTDNSFDYSPENAAAVGKQAGVDYVVGGKLKLYRDPSSGARAGAFAVTVLTSILPVSIMMARVPAVGSDIEVVRTADAKVVGKWDAMQTGGNFARCTSLTEDIADVIYDKQFNQ